MDITDDAGAFFMEVLEAAPPLDPGASSGDADSGRRTLGDEEEEEEGVGPENLVSALPGRHEEDDDDTEGELVEEEEEEDGILYYCKVLFFFCRVVVLLSVVFTGLFNLSIAPGEDSTLWTALLSSCVGYALSVRKLRGRRKRKTVHHRRSRRHGRGRRRRRYRLGAQDGGLDLLHPFAQQQFNGRVS